MSARGGELRLTTLALVEGGGGMEREIMEMSMLSLLNFAVVVLFDGDVVAADAVAVVLLDIDIASSVFVVLDDSMTACAVLVEVAFNGFLLN